MAEDEAKKKALMDSLGISQPGTPSEAVVESEAEAVEADAVEAEGQDGGGEEGEAAGEGETGGGAEAEAGGEE